MIVPQHTEVTMSQVFSPVVADASQFRIQRTSPRPSTRKRQRQANPARSGAGATSSSSIDEINAEFHAIDPPEIELPTLPSQKAQPARVVQKAVPANPTLQAKATLPEKKTLPTLEPKTALDNAATVPLAGTLGAKDAIQIRIDQPHDSPSPSPAPLVATNRSVESKGFVRPVAWEDDIAFNTLDSRPFTVNPSPAEMDISLFQSAGRLASVEKWLDGKPIAEWVQRDTCPIPVAGDREGYSPGQDASYWLSGLDDHFKILEQAKKHSINPKNMLDFGCATGRVIRHFAAQTPMKEIWGTDINHRHVRWLYSYLSSQVKPVFNHCIPTLPIADGSIDIISAFSVFTHIDTFETHWLAELSRILSDDGMCYLTVHNEDTWQALRTAMDNPNNRLIQSLIKIDPEFRSHIQQPMPAGRQVYRFSQSGPYRAQVFHSNCYLRNVWGRFFKVEAILPCHHVRQTVVVLRKK